MSSIKVCKKCDSNEIEVDRARGITYCTSCGNVLEESIIVSEVQIEEGSGGGVNIVGQFVGSNDTRAISINGLQNSLRESKEITLQNGKRLINEMASQLRLNQHCMDTAFNFYKLAVQRGLTRGRKIRQVIAACLYLVCRTEGTPHMLLDLCDIVHDDACYISSLGKLAMKFAYLLCIKLPEIDPGLFIPRFAQKLDFGEKTHDVTLTALRLVQRMNRDWMATGRRPSGLCGAALLVSARMYDFHRTLDDIVKVVKIGKTTLRKRMLEFEDTPSSNLTVDEFHTIDLEEEHDPPAYTRSRKFAKIKQIEEMTNIQEIEKEIMQLQENIEAALNELHKPRGIMAKYSKLCQFETEILGPNKDLTNIDTEIKEAEEFLSEEQINIIKSIVIDPNINKTGTSSNINNEDPNLTTHNSPSTQDDKWNNLRPTLRSLGLVRETDTTPKKTANDENKNLIESEDDLSDLDDEDIDYIDNIEHDDEDDDVLDEDYDLHNDDDDDGDDEHLDLLTLRRKRKKMRIRKKLLAKKRKLLESQQNQEPHISQISTDIILTNNNETSTRENETNDVNTSNNVAINNKNNNIQDMQITDKKSEDNKTNKDPITDDLDLTGIDDNEIDSMILSKDEIKTKAKLWLRANKDWLKEQKQREDQKKKDREEMKLIEPKQKKTRIRKPKNNAPVANPQEAIERMLQEKKLSSKINYDVLKSLNKDLKKT